MDIEKLEKLSCLRIKPSDKNQLEKSLEGVFDMMSQLEKIELPQTNEEVIKKTTIFREESFDTTLPKIKVGEKTKGMHIEETYFLAPKVIKK